MPMEYCRSDLFPGSVLEQNTADGSAVGISSDSNVCACHKTLGQPKVGRLEMVVVYPKYCPSNVCIDRDQARQLCKHPCAP